jgi:hypothetical protein
MPRPAPSGPGCDRSRQPIPISLAQALLGALLGKDFHRVARHLDLPSRYVPDLVG